LCLPKGSFRGYDTYGIHRAKPILRREFTRKSIFFQVDSKVEDGEGLLLSPSLVSDLSEKVRMYLGFGQKTSYGVFPQSSERYLNLSQLIHMQSSITKLIVRKTLGKVKRLIKPDKR